MPSFIKFVEIDTRGMRRSTRIWAVLSIDGKHCLGTIEWYAPWRKYSYATGAGRINAGTVVHLEETCMQDIIDFCRQQTGNRRQMWEHNRRARSIQQEAAS